VCTSFASLAYIRETANGREEERKKEKRIVKKKEEEKRRHQRIAM
jgi:hypothetical protein